MDAHPGNKVELMEWIDGRWGELQALLSELSDEEIEQPLGDGWSAKVHVAHLAAWERSVIALLHGADRGAAMALSPETWGGHDTDTINGALANRAEARAAGDVSRDARGTHEELLDLLDRLSEEDIMKPYSYYQPDDAPKTDQPVVGWINGNTWEHYEEHLGWLRAGLRN